MSNPLSAITESPGSTKFNIPHKLVSSLSDTDPVYKSDINITAPVGLIQTNPLNVL